MLEKGRKAKYTNGEAVKRYSAAMPESMADDLRKIGKGNLSQGIRFLFNKFIASVEGR